MTQEPSPSPSLDAMPPSITTYYEVLGISSQAQDQEIKEAYRSLALRMHPDKDPSNPKAKENFQKVFLTLSLVNSGQSPQDRPANQAMQQLIEAYETLSDTHRRQRYDLTLPQRQTRSAPSRSTVPQQGHRAHQGSKARASNQTSSYYWSQGYARAHPATGRKPSYDVNGEDWERAKYTLPPQDWYEKWTQTDNERQERCVFSGVLPHITVL